MYVDIYVIENLLINYIIISCTSILVKNANSYKRKIIGAVVGTVYSCLLYTSVLTPLGIEANGAKRWLGVGGATFQPSDIAKFACVVFTAKLIEKRYDKIKSLTKGVLPILIMPMIIFILIMLEPNMSKMCIRDSSNTWSNIYTNVNKI